MRVWTRCTKTSRAFCGSTPKKKYDNGTYGWSYIGSGKGNVHFDNLEVTRQVRQYEQKDTTKLSANDLLAYHAGKKDLEKQKSEAERMLKGILGFERVVISITKKIGKPVPSLADSRAYQPQGPGEQQVTKVLISVLSQKDDFELLALLGNGREDAFSD